MEHEEGGVWDRGTPLSREVVEETLTQDVFLTSWHENPGRKPGSESVEKLLDRLSKQMVKGDPFVRGYSNRARALLGPGVVSDFPGYEYRAYPTRGTAHSPDQYGRLRS
jgi:hypothetical protein